MAHPARKPTTTPRTHSKNGTKKPRATVEADARGGKTTSVCEASVDGSEPRADLPSLRRRELAALEESNRLQRQAEYRRRNEAIGFVPLIGQRPALPPMDEGEAAILRLLVNSPNGGATYDAIDRDQGPQDCQPYTASRLRRLQQRGYIEYEPLRTREKPTNPSDRAAWRDELRTAFRASTWRVTAKGVDRAKRFGVPPLLNNEDHKGTSADAEKPNRTFTLDQLKQGMSDDTFNGIVKAANRPAGPKGWAGKDRIFTPEDVQAFIDVVRGSKRIQKTRAVADRWEELLRPSADS